MALQTDRPVLAVNSGTAAIHLSLILAGVTAGDYVLCQSMTFVASANPIRYIGAIPVFVDSEPHTWNMDISFLKEAFDDLAAQGKTPKAIVLTSIYGMPYDVDAISAFAKANNLRIIDDSAEALGSSYKNRASGTLGDYGVISFNTNKILSTSGGGLLICPDQDTYKRALFLATQAKETYPYYEHKEIGFNYRMGHINALLGLQQLAFIKDRLQAKRAMHTFYSEIFSSITGVTIHKAPNTEYKSNYWLTAILVDPSKTNGITREHLRLALESANIESRPLWKPMHLQPLYADFPYYGGTVCEQLFEQGLCLPSGSNLTNEHRKRIEAAVLKVFGK
jgi:dTDP-4-amino-4,6-dideoxygalactose transaminase